MENLFFPQMKPENNALADLSIDEKSIYDQVKNLEKVELNFVKDSSGLSNKKWDKSIKNLTKKNLVKVSKTNEGLFIEIVWSFFVI